MAQHLIDRRAIIGIVGVIGALSGWHAAAEYANALRVAGSPPLF